MAGFDFRDCLRKANITGGAARRAEALYLEHRNLGEEGVAAAVNALKELQAENREDRAKIVNQLPEEAQKALAEREKARKKAWQPKPKPDTLPTEGGATNEPITTPGSTGPDAGTTPTVEQPTVVSPDETPEGAAAVSPERPGVSPAATGTAQPVGVQPGHGEGGGTGPTVSGPGGATTGTTEEGTPPRSTPDKDISSVEAGDTPAAAIETNPARAALNDYGIQEQDQLEEGSPKAKARRNIDAIRLLNRLDTEGRRATPEEQATLVRYTGWGGIPHVFDGHGEFRQEHDELKALLTPEEWKTAQASTLNAHYTTPGVIRAMWGAMERFGFKGSNKRILEPAAGIGHFFGLQPKSTLNQASRTAVEMDTLSGRLLNQLYQSANVLVEQFENQALPDNFFDVAIGNVPFLNQAPYGSTDKELNRKKFSLHNYFFAKSIKKLKPGSVMAFITSAYTMDAPTAKGFRTHMAEQADLLGAIRLPNNAFKGIANTEVTTDIIFLKKRKPGQIDLGEEWNNTVQTEMRHERRDETQPESLNEYYVRHPEMMLGTMVLKSGSFGLAPSLKPDGRNLEQAINEAVQSLPENVIEPYTPPKSTTFEGIRKTLPAPGDVKPNAFVVKDGKLFIKRGEELVEDLSGKPKDIKRIEAIIKVRDAMRSVFNTQLNNESEESIVAARQALNDVYDAFIKKNGFLNDVQNSYVYAADPDWPGVKNLEAWDPDTKTATKQAIFARRTIQYGKPATEATTAKDALLISLAETGGVDLDLMDTLYHPIRGKAPWITSSQVHAPEHFKRRELRGAIFDNKAEIVKELTGPPQFLAPDRYRLQRLRTHQPSPNLIFENPDGSWEHKDEYLSGNVKAKLKVAELAAKADPKRFQRNVNALNGVIPEDREIGNIGVRLGAPWIPKKDVTDFINEVINTKGRKRATVSYEPSMGAWAVGKFEPEYDPEWTMPRLKAQQRDSNGRMRSVNIRQGRYTWELVEATLNLKTVSLDFPTIAGIKGGKDEERTIQIQEKQEKILEAFNDWIWRDPVRAKRLHRKFNDEMNNVRLRLFDGSHLTMPGMNPDITLMPHQLDAIWRVLQTGNTLLAHEVGTGKTFELIGAAMEMRRLGLAQKPVLGVLNATMGAFTDEFLRMYPAANLLVPTAHDLQGKNRKDLVAKIATGDWDAIILSHENISKIGMSKASQKAFIEEQIQVLEDFLTSAQEAGDNKSSTTVKELERAKKALETKLKELTDDPTPDDGLTFEETGIDTLLVDEADKFKNLYFPTRMTRVTGLSSTASKRSLDLYMKSRYLNKLTNNRAMVFATGTPVSNTLAEIFTMQRFLQQDHMNELGMEHFDSWVRSFAVTEPKLGLSMTGQWQMQTIFRNFRNVPTMMEMFGRVMDIKFAKDLGLKLPPLRGGAHIQVAAEPSDLLLDYMEILIDRLENLPNDKSIDNHLKVGNDARHAALDLRLKVPTAPDDPGSKVNLGVANIAKEYRQWDEHKGTQLVFLDLSTPKNRKPKDDDADPDEDETTDDDDGYGKIDEVAEAQVESSVYEDIRQKLVKKHGIPIEQIEFAQSAQTQAQKVALYKKVNSGVIRILIGSTERMGTGVNVQERLVAIHNLDAPWRPRDLEQRQGRIMRQGNRLLQEVEGFAVAIYDYATKAPAFDARMWQTIQEKWDMIDSAMHYDPTVFEITDVGVGALSAAEMKAIASGNPLVFEKVELEVRLRKLRSLRRGHENESFEVKQRLAAEKNRVLYHQGELGKATVVAKYLKAHGFKHDPMQAPERFPIQKLRDEPRSDKPHFTIRIGGEELTTRSEAWNALEMQVEVGANEGWTRKAVGTFYGSTLVMTEPKRGLQLEVKGKDGKEELVPGYTAGLHILVPAKQPLDQPIGSRSRDEDTVLGDYYTYKAGRGQLQALEKKIKEKLEEPEYHEKEIERSKREVAVLSEKVETKWENQDELDRGQERMKEIDRILKDTVRERRKPPPPSRLSQFSFSGPTQPHTPPPTGLLPQGQTGQPSGSRRPSKAKKPPPRIQAAGITGEKPKNIRQILIDASRSLEKKLFRGRAVGGRSNAIGSFDPTTGAVLIKYAQDLDVASHEVAHALDHEFEVSTAIPLIGHPLDRELSFFWKTGSKPHAGSNPTQKLAYRRSEGFAEWTRAWIINPVATERQAPNFTKYALDRIPKHIQDALVDFGRDIRVFVGSKPMQKIMANIAEGPIELSWRDRWFGPTKNPGYQLRIIDRMATKWTDRQAPILRSFEWARKQRGIHATALLPSDNPKILARLFMGMNAVVEDIVRHGMIRANKTGRATGDGVGWLWETLDHSSPEALEADKREVSGFMIAQRTIEKAQQFGRELHISGAGGGIGNDYKIAQAAINDLMADTEKYKRHKEAARRYRIWARANLDYLHDHGRMDDEQYDAIIDNNEYYVSMQRIHEVTPDEKIVIMGPKVQGRHSTLGNVRHPIKTFLGSDLTVKDPYISLLDSSNQAVREADRNHFMRTFIDALVDPMGLPALGKALASVGRQVPADAKGNNIKVFRDGKEETWQFHEDVYKALKGMAESPVVLPKAFTLLPRILRATVVNSPPFAIRNVIRDAFHRTTVSHADSQPWDSLKHYTAMEKSDFQRFGGDQAGHYYTDAIQYQRAMKTAIEELTHSKTSLVWMGHVAGRKYLDLMQGSERQGRMAEYRRAFTQATTTGIDLGDGQLTIMDSYHAGLYAAGEARGLMNYAIAGEYMNWINQLVPFSNAAVQGIRITLLRAQQHPAQVARKVMMWAAIPSVLTLLFAASDDDTLKEYRQLPAWRRDLFYNFRIGKDLWIAIPKPFEIGMIGTSVERTVDYAMGNKQAFEGHLKSWWHTLSPIDEAGLMGPLQGVMQAALNRDIFREKDIVPYGERDLELGRRKTWRASRLGQVVQHALEQAGVGIDARKIDFIVKSTASYFGDYALRLSDVGIEAKRGFGMSDFGLTRRAPINQALDVQWVLERAKELGIYNTKKVSVLNDILSEQYDAKTAEARDRIGRRARDEAKRLRREWTLHPPYSKKKEANRYEKWKAETKGRPDPIMKALGLTPTKPRR